MAKLMEIEGVGETYQQKLISTGIKSTEALLEKGSTPKGRKEITEKSGIGEGLILKWVNHVDLFRIKGIGSKYADLLEAAGMDTVPELANLKPENLLEKMTATNSAKKLVRRLPVLSQVKSWVDQAKSLPRVITY